MGARAAEDASIAGFAVDAHVRHVAVGAGWDGHLGVGWDLRSIKVQRDRVNQFGRFFGGFWTGGGSGGGLFAADVEKAELLIV